MKISAIKPAVKTKGRYNIFLEGTYSFSLDEQQLLDAKLRLGIEISEKQLQELKTESDLGKKYARLLDLVLRRLRSEKEIRDYGRRKKWEPEVTDHLVQKLKTKGYVDDTKFTQSWVRARANLKHISRRKLILELRQKGVDGEIIEHAIDESQDYDESRALEDLISKKGARYPDRQKLIAYLARQGFSYDDIKQALESTSE